jgi:hypothetical protein
VGFVVDKVALGQVFPQELRFLPVNFSPPVLHYMEKRKKLIIFLIGLHNKPEDCGASEASAAGPFNNRGVVIDVFIAHFEDCGFECRSEVADYEAVARYYSTEL